MLERLAQAFDYAKLDRELSNLWSLIYWRYHQDEWIEKWRDIDPVLAILLLQKSSARSWQSRMVPRIRKHLEDRVEATYPRQESMPVQSEVDNGRRMG